MINILGNRMKQYEYVTRNYLPRRIPAIIRIDGKAFHTLTRKFNKPFDDIFMKSMWQTAIDLCMKIEGCKVAYCQSDEISLLLTDDENIETQAWFDKNIQKMVSVSASIATVAFNSSLNEYSYGLEPYYNCVGYFDSRVFVLPKEEVCNYFIWRQRDATRNSIQMIGQDSFSQKELHGKKCSDIQEMLFSQKSINFNDLPVPQKRGICCIKQNFEKNGAIRSQWVVDENIPVFTQDREYIEKYVKTEK
jgi:tRNA(His) guanylyltransferase